MDAIGVCAICALDTQIISMTGMDLLVSMRQKFRGYGGIIMVFYGFLKAEVSQHWAREW